MLGCKNSSTNLITPSAAKPANNCNDKDIVLHAVVDSIKHLVKEGDIVFRGGTDIESNIIRDFSYYDKLFSHCGICIKLDTSLGIAHMLGGESNLEGGLLYSSIEDFFRYPENESAGIYEMNLTKGEITRLRSYIDSLKKKNIDFDLKFNLFTKDKLYCTEMVIDAINSIKRKSQMFPYTKYYLKNTKYFFLTNKSDSFLFYPIDVFQHNYQLKEKKIFYFPNFQGVNITPKKSR